VTAGTAAAAAAAAANVAAAVEDWRTTGLQYTHHSGDDDRGADVGAAAFNTATSAATSAAADVIAEIGLAGRALNASWTAVGRANGSSSCEADPVEHTASSEAVEEAAAMVRASSAAMLTAHTVAGPSEDRKCESDSDYSWESDSDEEAFGAPEVASAKHPRLREVESEQEESLAEHDSATHCSLQ